MGMIELNADIGEGYADAALMPYLDRASIACGGHAGDAASMDAALALCARHGVLPGAHPSYPDRAHFGRLTLPASPSDIRHWVTAQIEALLERASRCGQSLFHVKPHGALYNLAARDRGVATAIAESVVALDRTLVLIGLAGSQLLDAGRAAGLAVLAEAFADRGYRADGSLVPRGTPGDVLSPTQAAEQAHAIRHGLPLPVCGRVVRADTLCVHGDSPDAPAIARAVRAALGG